VAEVDPPEVVGSSDVIVKVYTAGVCRTDVYVAEGRLPCPDRIILGHEFSGIVVDLGRDVVGLSVGDRVTANPLIRCGECVGCCRARAGRCRRLRMLGVEWDGAFADYVRIPAATVVRLPPDFPFSLGAFVEPVAASLAVLKAGIHAEERGVIYGRNRIADLTQRVLAAHGISNVIAVDPNQLHQDSGDFDFVVETMATEQSLRVLVDLVRPGGKVVLKSRPPQAIAFDCRAAVLNDVTLQAVNYGSFNEAVKLLGSGKLVVDDLIGTFHELEEFSSVLGGSAAEFRESAKPFFVLAHASESLASQGVG
jgi:L-iditol 2-dehydrogenase